MTSVDLLNPVTEFTTQKAQIVMLSCVIVAVLGFVVRLNHIIILLLVSLPGVVLESALMYQAAANRISNPVGWRKMMLAEAATLLFIWPNLVPFSAFCFAAILAAKTRPALFDSPRRQRLLLSTVVIAGVIASYFLTSKVMYLGVDVEKPRVNAG